MYESGTKKNRSSNRGSNNSSSRNRNSNLSKKKYLFDKHQLNLNIAMKEANLNSENFNRERRYTHHNKRENKRENNSRNQKINQYSNTVIDRLPNNLRTRFLNIPQELPFDDIDTIIGPFTMRICKLKYGNTIKNFFIFGENHKLNYGLLGRRQFNPSSTVAFDGFIKALVKKYNKINFDLYTEQGYFEKNNINNQARIEEYKKTQSIHSILKLIEYTFADCLQLYDKSKCDYNNLRVHLADLRNYLLDKDLIYRFYHEYLQLNIAPEDILITVNNDLNDIIREFSNPTSKMRKQRKGIPDVILDIIDGYFHRIFNNQDLSLNNIIEKITAIMDKYTVLRMFRPLDEVKNTYGRGTKNWVQQNIIGYFGNNHSYNIFTLLNFIGHKLQIGFALPPIINTKKQSFNSYITLDESVKKSLHFFIQNYDTDDIARAREYFAEHPIPE